MEEETKQQGKQYDWLKPHQFKPGQSGNPNGRPKGKMLKTWIKEHFQEMTDEERAEFLNKIDPIKAWEMGEGKAQTNIDHTTDGKELPTPILTLDVLRNDSNEEDSETKQED